MTLTITDEMIDAGAQALWTARETWPSDFDDDEERKAAWANAQADAEAVLEAALAQCAA